MHKYIFLLYNTSLWSAFYESENQKYYFFLLTFKLEPNNFSLRSNRLQFTSINLFTLLLILFFSMSIHCQKQNRSFECCTVLLLYSGILPAIYFLQDVLCFLHVILYEWNLNPLSFPWLICTQNAFHCSTVFYENVIYGEVKIFRWEMKKWVSHLMS